MTADIIRKQTVFKAPLERVWCALSDASEFGQWFGVRFDAPAFTAGEPMTGHIVPTVVDPKVAEMQKPYEGTPFSIVIARIEPPHVFAFQWHPFGIDKDHDYSQEPMTTVTFVLEAVEGGTQLTLTEEGFDNIPAFRRAQAFAANDGGWSHQIKVIEAWLALRS